MLGCSLSTIAHAESQKGAISDKLKKSLTKLDYEINPPADILTTAWGELKDINPLLYGKKTNEIMNHLSALFLSCKKILDTTR